MATVFTSCSLMCVDLYAADYLCTAGVVCIYSPVCVQYFNLPAYVYKRLANFVFDKKQYIYMASVRSMGVPMSGTLIKTRA